MNPTGGLCQQQNEYFFAGKGAKSMAEQKMKNTGDYVIEQTREYFDNILIEQHLINSTVPSLEMELFGETFASPIMTPAFSHLNDGMIEYAKAMKAMNQVNWIGMGENDEFERIAATGARTIKIVKPYMDRAKIFDQIRFAEEHGAFAVGVDIDHAFGNDGNYDICVGEKMIAQSADDIEELVKSTKLPFIIKGVLSVQDAAICAERGVAGIVVSHHHGRMPYAIPPLMVLPDIKAEVGNQMKIFVDCSIDSGSDAFKAIAMGADAVSVGRAMMPSLKANGCQGVVDFVTKMNEELKMIMAFTGFKTVKDIDDSVLWL